MSLPKKKNLNAAELARLTDLLEEVSQLDGTARARFLSEKTKGEPWLRQELEFFLKTSRNMEEYLETPAVAKLVQTTKRGSQAVADYPNDTVINKEFKILRVLGRGGLATVYLARHIPLDRVVALKVCRPEGDEARTLAHLEHDHIVKVFSESLDAERNLRLICMPVVPGANLEEVMVELSQLKKERVTGADWLDIIDKKSCIPTVLDPSGLKYRRFFARMDHLEVCTWMAARLADALAYAHERQILHLDVKPSNVLISQYGRPFLTDFNVSLDKRNVSKENLGGTRNFMAPEHVAVVEGDLTDEALEQLGPSTDIFSLVLTMKYAMDVGSEKPDQELSAILARATKKDVKKRYVDGAKFSRAMQSHVELHSVRKAMPGTSFLGRIAERFPLTSLTIVGALPQLVASVVCTYYNAIYIVGRLTPKQMATFAFLGQTYLPTVFFFSTVLWLTRVYPIFQFLRRSPDSSQVTELRRRVRDLPIWALLFTTMGWLPAGVTFPLTIHLASGALSMEAIGHFAIVFILGWSLSLSYSILLNYYVTLRFLYPRFFYGCVRVRETATKELQYFSPWLGSLQSLAILVPIAAIAILLLSPGESAEGFFAIRQLALRLLAVTVFGVFFALNISKKVTETMVALTRADRRK